VQGFYNTDPTNQNPPAFVITREQYGRIVRLTDRNIPVKLELSLQTRFYDDKTGSNVVGEITGTDPKLKDEVVLLGGHFDSWHSGTGATDNGAGCAAMLEALRILKAIGVKPRRTIRVALWDGEEQSYYGSTGYVKKHYGDPNTGVLKPDSEKLAAYYNLDNGTGRIRGVFLQGNEAVRPIFAEYLKPFNYLGANTLTILNTGGTDHMVFDALNLPGFQFIQDPIDYESRTHHTNIDVLEAVNEEDLKVNAVIIAAFAYQTAMRDEKLPRKKSK
jgi:Zn-dependent M28 family amino/carboxypeptidase